VILIVEHLISKYSNVKARLFVGMCSSFFKSLIERERESVNSKRMQKKK
jgi:hypothetical protein